MKEIKIFIFYFLLIIYSLECLLFFFTSEKIFSREQLKEKRIELAKNNGLEFDTRTPEEAFIDFRKKHEDLQPVFYYSPIFKSFKTFINAKQNNGLIPFRGPINSKSLTCAEEGKYTLVENDMYGFKNQNELYEKKINSILLGDSYAEGKCQNSQNDIAGHLTKKGSRTVSLGVSGTSALIALGIMKEFGSLIKPDNFIYLYYEGNDLDGLNWEKKEKYLLKYLEKDHTYNYVERFDEIKSFLKSSTKESINYLNTINSKKNKTEKSKYEKIKENFIDIIELKKTKNIIRKAFSKKKYLEPDLNLLFLIFNEMKYEVEKQGANFIFVYVPNFVRYIDVPDHSYGKQKNAIDLKDEILKEVNKMKIKNVDLTNFFNNAKNIERYYPLGYVGHFNAKGYEKIAEIIFNKIK